MNRNQSKLSLLLLGLAAAALLFAAGCAEKPRAPGAVLDTPEHHSLRGNDLIDKGDWAGAKREFDLALSLDKKYSPALAGKAVVTAQEANAPGLTADQKEKKADAAKDLYKDALSQANGDDDKRTAHVAAIRVHQMTQVPKDWLDETRSHYKDAVDTKGAAEDPNPHFYQARAERSAFNLNEASNLYQKVLSMNRSKTKEADAELSVVQKVIRAQPGSRYGKQVAFLEKVSRADMAALFIAELQLDRLYTRGNPQTDTSFKPPEPGDFPTDQVVKAPAATDIADHPLRADIEEVMNLKVVGLEPDPSHKFNPNAGVARAEFAIMVEDILVKVTNETKVRTKFIGQVSPFADVRNDLPYFNAVMTVTTRNLLEAKDKVRGLFAPSELVSGAEALLVIRLMKDELKSYLRS
jgi:tetratricopeptide (TPR) repeat protein